MPAGEIVEGVVQGAGGPLTSLAVLLSCQANANDGRYLRCYEPRPGCVLVFPGFSAHGNGQAAIVDLRTAQISEVA